MTGGRSARHPDEGDLVRLLDNELDAEEHATLENHVVVCQQCSTSLELLRQTAAQFHMELEGDAIDTSSAASLPRVNRRRPRVGWRIAAAIAVLLPLSATLRPVRAFMASGWESVVEVLGLSADREAAPETVPSAASPAGAVVGFSPRGSMFTIEVASRQPTGAILLEVVSGDNASAQIMTPSDHEAITVVPNSGFRISNTLSSTSDYRVEVPQTLHQVIVRVAGERIAEFIPNDDGESVSVQLTRR